MKKLRLLLFFPALSLRLLAQNAPATFPCLNDPQARQFDFWTGEWNVYPTGKENLVGHSLVQVVSGGCALLENWEATNGTNTGKSLNFVDIATHKWQQTWVGSAPADTKIL